MVPTIAMYNLQLNQTSVIRLNTIKLTDSSIPNNSI